MCFSGIHLPLFIVLFGKLSSTSFSVPKKQVLKTNCNDEHILGTMDNGIFCRQIMIKLTTGNNKQSSSERETVGGNRSGLYQHANSSFAHASVDQAQRAESVVWE